ncbi:P-loop containing nucleoside triphosphate hydrolase protein [Infundibulicybe gibba]|nr:P-loop containing nucleoside triphosphate hydrolase protein [Infundibulicybe gibba]
MGNSKIKEKLGTTPSIESTLKIVDDEWYAHASKNARWMDLLGDYAGNEPFCLQEFTQRSANFEVVFWNGLSFYTLARVLLFQHLLNTQATTQISVHVFEDIDDPAWLQYETRKKPMFIMVHDGGLPVPGRGLSGERIIGQRVFIYRLLSRGIAISLLNGAEYRDSKILSFVYAPKQRALDSSSPIISIPSSIVDDSAAPERTADDVLVELVREISKDTATSLELMFVFMIHCLLLRHLSVSERALPPVTLTEGLAECLAEAFLPQVYLVATRILSSSRGAFDIDGRVFTSLLSFIFNHPSTDIHTLVGAHVAKTAKAIWDAAGVPPVDVHLLSSQFSVEPTPAAPAPKGKATKSKLYHLLPFSNPVLDDELSIVRVPEADAKRTPTEKYHLDFGGGVLFSDTKHWHNDKDILPGYLGGKSHQVLDERARRRLLRSNQRFMATLQMQAATLTGASGKGLQQISIPAVGSIRPKALKHGATSGKNIPKSQKAPQLSSADKLRKKIREENLASKGSSSQAWWKEQLKLLAKMTTSAKTNHVESLLRNKRSDEPQTGLEILLYQLHLDFLRWIEDDNRESPSSRDQYTLAIMRKVKIIRDREFMTSAGLKVLTYVLQALGFSGLIEQFNATPALDAGLLSFEFKKLIKSKTQTPYYDFMTISENPITWQLRLFGEFMDRSMDSAPDVRVAFEPDAWQRKVLDCIDADHSLLVVAPTSAGKTFISYYAMEKVLRNSDDGILVYIAPTKALVSQIAAEVYARSCWAIHTRDYRVHDPQKCQILVTVPEMLAIMLLSPPLARVWTPRIKRIILDEIHSIGQQEGGAVWEQIILLAPCPIIGLSATIGSPHIFNDWLQSVQEAHGYKHTFIEHPHRYSHLRKSHYLFRGDKLSNFSGLDSHQNTGRIRFLHPITMMSFGARSLPPDLALEASDTLSLYRALVTRKAVSDPDLQLLDPVTFFGSRSDFLRQADILRYEAALKEAISTLVKQSDPQDPLEDPTISRLPRGAAPDGTTFLRDILPLVADLHVRGELPAILFNFDRSKCEDLAKELIRALVSAEEKWRLQSPTWQKKIRDWEAWKLRARERERLAERAKKQKKDADGKDTETTSHMPDWEASFNPDDPSLQFSFAGIQSSYSRTQLEEMSCDCLFRQGFVRVVIATGTLALGINAPAKTSYRQCAGRAGRRGYDLLGNVLFYGLSLDRMQRLILSRLPSLGGNFPLSPTLTLRLLNLLVGSNDAPVAVKAVKSLFHFLVSALAPTWAMISYCTPAISIEVLRRNHLIDADGRPMNLFAIVAHLYYTEPSNLALVALLRQGVLHRICGNPSTIQAKYDFILLMANLFGRRYLNRVYADESKLAEVIKKSPSMVLIEFDQEILDAFNAYAVAYTSEHADQLGRSTSLPLSKLDYSGNSNDSPSPSLFRKHLQKIAIPAVTRSRFVATSGHGDHFNSVKELCGTAREGLHLYEHAIPSVRPLFASWKEGKDGPEHALNAYLLDFYKHGQVKALTDANGIRRGDIWYLLEDFDLTLATVKTTLEQLLLNAEALHNAEALRHATAGGTKSSQQEAEGFGELDSGYESLSLAGPDSDDDESDNDAGHDFKRPGHTSNGAWRVYEIVRDAHAEFNAKYKAMWA